MLNASQQKQVSHEYIHAEYTTISNELRNTQLNLYLSCMTKQQMLRM